MGDELKEEDQTRKSSTYAAISPQACTAARLAESKTGDWSALHPIWSKSAEYAKDQARGDARAAAPRCFYRSRAPSLVGSRGGGRAMPCGAASGRHRCWRCGGVHFSIAATGAGCEVPCYRDICEDHHATAHYDKYAEAKKKRRKPGRRRARRGAAVDVRAPRRVRRRPSGLFVLEKPYLKTVHTVNFQKKEPCAGSKSSQPPYEVVPVDFALDDDDDSLPDLASISDTSDTNSEADSLVSSEVGSLDYDSDDLPDLESYTEAGSLVNSKVGSLGYESDDSKLSFLSGDDVLNADLRLNARTGEWEVIDDEPAPGLGDQWEFVPRPELLSIDKKPPALDPHHLFSTRALGCTARGTSPHWTRSPRTCYGGWKLSATTAEGNNIKATKKGNVSVPCTAPDRDIGDNRSSRSPTSITCRPSDVPSRHFRRIP